MGSSKRTSHATAAKAPPARDPGTATHPEAQGTAELDLEAQLEALLAEIESREPGVVVRKPEVTPEPSAKPEPQSTPPTAPAVPTADAVAREAEQEAAEEPQAPPPPPTPAESPMESPAASPAASPVAASEPPAATADDNVEQQLADLLQQVQSLGGESSPSPEPQPQGEAEVEPTVADAPAAAEPLAAEPAAADPNDIQAVVDEAVAESLVADEPVAEASVKADDNPVSAAEPVAEVVNGADTAAEVAEVGFEADADAEPASASPAPGLNEDDLAAQLQAILDAAKPKYAPATIDEPTAEATEATTAEASEGDRAAPASTATVATAASDDDATIQALDDILAEEADAAIAGEFETIDDVLTEPVGPPPAPAPEIPLMATAPTEAGDGKLGDDSDEPDLTTAEIPGQFETPEELLGAPEAATAAPEAAAPAPEADSAKPVQRNRRRRSLRLPLPPPVVIDLTYHMCTVVNAPLRQLSPEMRSTVGYIAAMNLVISLGLVVYGLFN